MKKDELVKMEAAEVNMDMNEKMNEDSKLTYQKEGTNSATEANIAIQEEFYGENNEDEVPPSFIYNNIPAIKFNSNDK
ncbi:hypothetical protein [Psychrobacillus lasiicapitis]|uniref:Uncharacterized protein n=1 Tax=Psychrobacillus lasiicapitis TaxID=1636719 RepID=A0A544SZY7_9BACI|nr:hypothetical protein [Psychrobacillus lasiicapitis]TQR10765.1 hypothetical protein FG382_17040 [Psychrobacillus lasiicapitis]GGA42649.1 hypothetical protein GCM10011384_35500 [Psychrobacillus lasiicapitis]